MLPLRQRNRPEGGLSIGSSQIALAELFAATCGMQTDLLAFHSAWRHCDENRPRLSTGLIRVVVDQGTGDAVAGRAGLAGFAAAVDVDLDVEGLDVLGQHQGLLIMT